jgi:hypothetical protein
MVRAGTFGPWRCELHERQAQVPTLRAARVVDVYHPSGLRDRFIYRIDEWKLDGRDENDAFAPHPAWAASRAAVRERPAASGTWNTFVFASRPTAEMFGQSALQITRDKPVAIVRLNERRAIVVLTFARMSLGPQRVAPRAGEAVW